MKIIKLAVLTVILSCVPLSASAMLVHWTLDNVTLHDGGTVEGSFVYDADADSYSNIAIETTTGSDAFGDVYPVFRSGSSIDLILQSADLPDLTGERLLQLVYSANLTGVGGVVSLDATLSKERQCINASCGLATGAPALRDFTGGTLIGTVVPLPPAVWLFGSALGLLGWMRRKLA